MGHAMKAYRQYWRAEHRAGRCSKAGDKAGFARAITERDQNWQAFERAPAIEHHDRIANLKSIYGCLSDRAPELAEELYCLICGRPQPTAEKLRKLRDILRRMIANPDIDGLAPAVERIIAGMSKLRLV